MSLAFLFPGQGSQYPGMTATIESIYPPARALFEEANWILEIDLHSLAQQGPAEELTRTENAQPALLMVSVCWLQFLLAQGISPQYLAGHSLGEYSALVASGALNWRDALRLVRRRGELMSAAAAKQSGGMVAVIGLGQDSLLEVLREASRTGCVELANYNTAEQVVLSGEFPALEKASELARKRGAKLVRSLQVSAPFHSSLMRPVAEQFQKELDQFAFQDAEIPVLSNVTARPMQRTEEIRHALILQIDHPVLWADSIRWLFANGVDHFLEVGAKNVLTGLVRRMVPETKAEAVEEQFLKEAVSTSRNPVA